MKEELEAYFDRLWPICRSITGNGLRASLDILSELVPLEQVEVPTGTRVFDWEVPKEWNIRDAYIVTPSGEKIAEFKVNNLHVLNYSTPVDKLVSLEELKQHVYTLPAMPNAVPYITSYYKEKWGFCMTHEQFEQLEEGEYRVYIDADLAAGSLTYGQCYLPGETEEEVLFSTYVCHPSMANNELSGPLVAAFLYKRLAAMPKRKYSYRFVFAPETIGVIAFLDHFGQQLKEKLKAGYVLTCCGDAGAFVYKRSKHRTSLADRIAEHVLRYQDVPYEVIDFAVGGSDERQYCSPGFNFPVGSLTRSMYQRYKEYHTSLDNKDFISFSAMEQTVETYYKFAQALELNDKYKNNVQFCEPQLGKRDLYPSSFSPDQQREEVHNLLHFLSFADGEMDLIDIAERRNRPIWKFENAVRSSAEKGLLA